MLDKIKILDKLDNIKYYLNSRIEEIENLTEEELNREFDEEILNSNLKEIEYLLKN